VTVQVTNTGQIVNCANAYGATTDPNTDNNASCVTNNAVAPSADVSMTKYSSVAGSVNVGDQITYTLYAYNYGPSTSSNVVVRDAIPTGTVYLSASGGSCTFYPNFQRVDCDVGNLGAGNSAYVYVTVQVTNAGQIVNFANAFGTTPDPNTTNNTSGVTNTAANFTASADVSLTKYSSSSNNVQVGQQIIYTLAAFNSGPAIATNVVIHDTIPSGVSYVSASGGACSYNSGTRTVDCSVGSLSSGGQATVYVTVQVNGTGQLINTANATLDTYDPNLSNNTSSVTNTGVAAQADLSLTKYTSASTPRNIGDQIIYTLGAFNGGPSIASNVVMRDTLPAGVTLVSVTGSGNSYSYDTNLNRVDVNLGNLAVAGSTTTYLTVQVNAQVGTLLNCANIFSDMSDSNQANNTSCVTNVTTLPTADLQITKTANSNSVSVGSTVVFNLTARNNGPSTITNQITVSEVIPSGFDYVSDNSSGTGAYYSYGLGQWVFPTGLVANATKTLAITLRANTNGVFTNTATINVPSGVTDPNTNNNSSSAVVTNTVPQADLQITKTVNSNSVPVGQNVVFQLTLINAGPNNVTNSISVNEAIPPGFQYVSDNSFASGTTYSAGVGLWTIFNGLGSGSNVVLNITMQAVSAGTYTNRAIINVPSGINDPNTNNNSSSVVVTNTVLPADVQITKTANKNSALQGAPIVFTITASNLGPNTASNVVVQDIVPSGVIVTASNVPPGTAFNSGTAAWTIPSLANGAAVSLQLTMVNPNPGTVTNVARIVSSATSDPNLNNNTNSAAVTWASTNSADLGIRITLSTNVVLQGGIITVEFAVTNIGPQDASNIMIYAPVPPGTVFVSQGGSLNWNYNFATGVWTRNGSIVAGFEYYFGFDLRATNSGTIAVTAAITNSSPTDVFTNNNFASTNFTVIPVVNLSGSARQCTNNGSVMPGVTITLTTTNGFALTNVTDASGNYSFTNLLPGLYTITPSSNGFGFTPANYIINATGGTTNFPPFVATPRTISGSVLMGTNTLGVPGITIQLSGAANSTTLTGTNGTFTFTNLNPGNYTVTPLTNGIPGARFTPTNATYALGDPTNCSRTLTFYLTNTLIVLRAIEVNQSVQDWENSVPLVQDKPTLVRVFLQLPGTNTTAIPLMGAQLRGTRGGTALGVLPNPAYTVWTNDIAPWRSNLNSSVNFVLPANWLNGTIDLAFEWTNGVVLNIEPREASGLGVGSNGAVRVAFTPMPSLPVKWVFVSWTNATPHPATMANAMEIQARTRAMFPLANITPQFAATSWITNRAPVESNMLQALSLMRTLDIIHSYFSGNTNAGRQLYYGFATQSGMRGEAAGIPDWISCGNFSGMNSFDYQRHLAQHEMAHTLGRHHAVNGTILSYTTTNAGVIRTNYYTQGICSEYADTNAPAFPMFAYPFDGNRPTLGPLNAGEDKKVFGYDNHANLIVNPYFTYDLMSYCVGTGGFPKTAWPWTAKYTYTNLMNIIINRFGSGGAPRPTFNLGQQQLLIVRGQIDLLNDDLALAPFVIVPTPVLPPLPPPGEFLLELYDQFGQVVQQISFQPDLANYEDVADTRVQFTVSVPYDPSIRGMMIFRNGVPIGERIATPNAPAVQVVFPNGGETLGDPTLVQWTASDLDGDTLTYTLEFSADGGNNWETIVADWPDTSYPLSTEFLRATTFGKIRVIATDGFNTAIDDTDGFFTIGNHAPHVVISSPTDQQVFVGHDQLVLQASAYDTEDGVLTNIVWASSLDGALGSGELVVRDATTLTEGTHVLTATATDSGGLTNAATVSVTIYRDNPPLLNIALNNPNVLLWWSTNSTNYHLQRALSLPGSWSDVTNSTSIVSNQVQVTLPASGAAKFYRLIKP